LQVLFSQVQNPWAKTVATAIDDGEGDSIIGDQPDFPKLAAEKNASPLLAVVLRIAVAAPDGERLQSLSRKLEAFFRQFARPDGNALIPLANDGYPDELHEDALLSRTSFRTGMILSLDELVGLVHLPDKSIRHEALERESGTTKRAPPESVGHELVLGINAHAGREVLVTVPRLSRLEHMHLIGVTGRGKSTLLLNLITQDIEHGDGLAVLDPHGDLVDDILERVPESRVSDIIVFDPSDVDYPIGFNILTATSEIEQNLIASDAVAMFRRLSTSWGDAMTTVLAQGVLAMLASPTPTTLVDLRRFLVDESFRGRFLEKLDDPEIAYFWAKEFPLIGARSFGPILTRLDTFLRMRMIRNIVGQRTQRLDIARVIAERKVFLARLSKGLIGEENAALLGSLICSKFQQCALARQRIPQTSRSPFYFYVDEFQNFVTPSVGSLLAEGRKFGVGLVLAHQDLGQLKSSGQVESSVLGSTHTRIVFRVSDSDARQLAEGFASFEASDLQNLSLGDAIVRMGGARNDFNLKTFPRKKAGEEAEAIREQIIDFSRETYARARRDVEAEVAPPKDEERVQLRNAESAVLRAQPAATLAPTQTVESVQPAEPEIGDVPVPPKPKRRQTEPLPPKELGKGGDEHRYLQHLIKRLGEERGFRAIIEEDIGARRSIDVVLRRDALSLAFEISIATEIDHEVENLRKCGVSFTQVFFVSKNKRKRDEAVRRLKESGVTTAVVALAPEDIVAALDTFEAPPTSESKVRGYKVKVSRQLVSYQDIASKRSAIAEVIARSLTAGNSKRR
jgi:hypothetical protein